MIYNIEDSLLLLADTENELNDALSEEKSDVARLDNELQSIEARLEEIVAQLLVIEEQMNPDLQEVEKLYREYLDLSNRQSQITDALEIGFENIGLMESVLY